MGLACADEPAAEGLAARERVSDLTGEDEPAGAGGEDPDPARGLDPGLLLRQDAGDRPPADPPGGDDFEGALGGHPEREAPGPGAHAEAVGHEAEAPRAAPGRPRRLVSDPDAFDLVERDRVAAPVVELGGPRRGVGRDGLRVLDRPAVGQIRRYEVLGRCLSRFSFVFWVRLSATCF